MPLTSYLDKGKEFKIGFCDRVILLDTGLVEITDEKILELFDFIQVPIEIKKGKIDGGECRNPQYARPSMEANGINVCELNKTAGWSMKRDADKVDTDRVSMGAVYGLVLVG